MIRDDHPLRAEFRKAIDFGFTYGSLDDAEVAKMPEVKAALRDVVMAANEGLGRWETIKDFAILPAEMTTETGELTPSLKMKRRVIDERYEQLIDELYPNP